MWAVEASAITWLIGGELHQEAIPLARVAEGEVALRRVATADQERWRRSRRVRMQGRGALGDADGERGYPYVPLPEWLLDCCTVAAEVRNPAVCVADDAVPLPQDRWLACRACPGPRRSSAPRGGDCWASALVTPVFSQVTGCARRRMILVAGVRLA